MFSHKNQRFSVKMKLPVNDRLSHTELCVCTPLSFPFLFCDVRVEIHFHVQASGPGMVSGLDKATDSAHTISTVHTPIATPTPQPQANVRSRKLESANVLPPGYAAVDGPDPAEEVSKLTPKCAQICPQICERLFPLVCW